MRYQTIIDGELTARAADPAFQSRFDVLVVGMGTAGAVAVVAAARLGLRVCGAERESAMGGTGTLGGVWHYYFGQTGGVYEDVLRRCRALSETGLYAQAAQTDETGSNYPAVVKCLALEQCALENGAALLYETVPVGVYMEGSRVAGVRFRRGEEDFNIAAAVTIDATASGGVARLAGCRMLPFRASDGAAQMSSRVHGVVTGAQREAQGSYQATGRANRLDPAGFARDSLRAMLPPYEKETETPDTHAVYEAPVICAREGAATVRLDDYLAGRAPEQPVFFASSHNDYCNRDLALEDDLLHVFQGVCNLYSLQLTIPVPMGALIPERADGLLTAGSCMSIDHDATGCVRMKRDMEKSGEAAAVLAALAVRRGVQPRQVPYEALAARLRETGCLNETHYTPWDSAACGAWKGPAPLRPYGWLSRYGTPRPPARWDDESLLAVLSSDDPRLALWRCYARPDECRGALLRLLPASRGPLRERCALALGLAGCAEAAPVLRDMARDGRPPREETWQGGNMTMRMRAVCALGLLGDAESLPIFMSVLEAPLPEASLSDGPAVYVEADRAAALFLEAETAAARVMAKHPEGHAFAARVRARVFAPDMRLRFCVGGVDLLPAARRVARTL